MELDDATRVIEPALDERNDFEQDAYRLYVASRCPEIRSRACLNRASPPVVAMILRRAESIQGELAQRDLRRSNG